MRQERLSDAMRRRVPVGPAAPLPRYRSSRSAVRRLRPKLRVASVSVSERHPIQSLDCYESFVLILILDCKIPTCEPGEQVRLSSFLKADRNANRAIRSRHIALCIISKTFDPSGATYLTSVTACEKKIPFKIHHVNML